MRRKCSSLLKNIDLVCRALLQKGRMFLGSLLIVATPQIFCRAHAVNLAQRWGIVEANGTAFIYVNLCMLTCISVLTIIINTFTIVKQFKYSHVFLYSFLCVRVLERACCT